MNQVFEILKRTRESKGWNKSQMAKELDISSQLYGQYESGKKQPGAELFIKWKQKFGSDLLSDDETKVSQPSDKKESLERAVENLSEDKIRTTGVIERLVTLLEDEARLRKQMLLAKPEMPLFPKPGTPNIESKTRAKKPSSGTS